MQKESNSTQELKFKIVSTNLDLKTENLKIILCKVEKPLFSKWKFVEIERKKFTSSGECVFLIKEIGQYSFRLYDAKEYIASDDNIIVTNYHKEVSYDIKL